MPHCSHLLFQPKTVSALLPSDCIVWLKSIINCYGFRVGFALCLFCPVLLLGVFSCAWLIVGSVWVYHTDPGCTESLYEAGQYIVIASWVLLALNCILQCCARLITIRI